MSIINTIYKIPPADKSQWKDQTVITLTYNGKVYTGVAYCHPDDMGFMSKKVGQRIALSRARLRIMKTELEKEINKYNVISNFYSEITINSPEPNEFSTFEGRYLKLAGNTFKRIKTISAAIKKEENSLKEYLKGLDKAISSVKKIRDKGQK